MMARMSSAEVGVRSLRLVVQRPDGALKKLVKIVWSQRDASLYLTPYAPVGGFGYVGVTEKVGTFSLLGQGQGRDVYLSLHKSGQTHATCKQPFYRTESVKGPALFVDKRSHVATAVCFDTASLPDLGSAPRHPPHLDYVLLQLAGLEKVDVPIFVSAVAESLEDFPIRLRFVRPDMPGPLHFGLRVRGEEYRPEPDSGGVAVLGGWGVDPDPDLPLRYAFAATRASSVP